MEFDEQQLQQLMASGNTVLNKGDMQSMDREQLKAMQNQGPSAKDISAGMQQGFDAIKDMRADADVAKRIEIAESCKTDANEKLAAGSAGNALKAYLVGIWLLMRGDPEPTRSLVAPVATERDAKISLGAGVAGMTDTEAFGESYAQQISELRTALHLNVAAATLKLNMFAVASLACGVVLEEKPEHPKALFRSAKAGEGAGDLGGAIATLGKLLKVEGQADNLEARRLLQSLRARKTKEAKIYGGFFEKAREDGGSLYAEAEKTAEPTKISDLKKGSEEQDNRTMKDILKNRLARLPQKVQKELRQMGKVGLAPSEFMKAYRRFLKDELKGMARDTVPEELSEIMSVMQATEDKMEAVIDKVKALIAVRKLHPWRLSAGRWCYQGRAPAADACAAAPELPSGTSCPSSAWRASAGRWRHGDRAEIDQAMKTNKEEAAKKPAVVAKEAFKEAERQKVETVPRREAAAAQAELQAEARLREAKAYHLSADRVRQAEEGEGIVRQAEKDLEQIKAKRQQLQEQDEAATAQLAQILEQSSREGSALMRLAKICNFCGR